MRPESGHKRQTTDPNACPCCKVCSRCTGFQKVLAAPDAGYVLYRHTTKVEDINKNTGAVDTITDTVDDVFILENTQGSPLGKIDVISDIGQSQIKCPRCIQLLKHAEKLLKNTDFGKSDIVGICEHCRKFGSTCLKCEEAVEMFQESRKAQKQSQAQRVKTWLSKIQKIIKVSLFDDKKRGHEAGQMVRGFSDVDLNNLVRQITKKEHEPEIQDLFLHDIRDFYSTKRGPQSESPYYPGERKDKELLFHEPSKTDGVTQKEYMPTRETSYEREKLDFIPIRMKRQDTDSLMQSNITLSEDELEKDFILKFGKSYKGNKKFSTPSDSKWFKDEDFLPLPEKRHEYEKRKVEPTSKSYLDDSRISPESRKYYEEKRDKGYVDDIKKQDFKKRSETAKMFGDDAPKMLKSVADIYHDEVKQREYDPTDEKLYEDDKKRAKSLPKTLVDYDIRKRKEFITATDEIPSAKESEKRVGKRAEPKTKIIYESPSRIRRYRSEESLLTGITKMKDDVQKQETFAYYFPQTEESRKKKKRERVVSSSELIKDTLDKLKSKIEEERKKREEAERLKEERRKKLEQEKKEREAKMLAHKMEKIKEDTKHQVSKEILLRDDQVKDKALKDKSSKEKIIKEKASKDKEPKEKAFKEKASTEKVPKDKLPKDKISKDKLPTDKEPKDKVLKEKVPKEQESKEKIKKEVPEPKKKEKLEKPERKIKEDSGREGKVKESIVKEEKPKIEKPKEEKPKEENPKEEKPKEEKSKEEKPKEEKPKEEKPKEEKPKEEKPKEGKPKEEKPKEKDHSIKDDHEKEKKKRELEAQELKSKLENEQKQRENQMKELQLQREEARKQKLQEQEKAKEEAAKLKQTMKAEMPEQKIEVTKIKLKKPSIYDLIQERNRPKERSRTPKDIELPSIPSFEKHMVKHGKKESSCDLCIDSDYEFEVQNIFWKKNADSDKKDKWKEAVLGSNIFKYKTTFEAVEAKEPSPDLFHRNYEQENYEQGADDAMDIQKDTRQKSQKTVKADQDYDKGIIRYALSDRTFIEKGWTKLPTEKVVRKMNVYRMRPAHPEFDWFEHNKKKGIISYDTGEKLAEFNENGRGQWFYRSGLLALDHYNAEEMNAQQRFVVYSSGEPDQRGRSRPRTVLATFDYLGNGIVFDHTGKIRLKYNQTEGIVLDRSLGPVSHWKWHTLNDPPVLQQVMIDTQVAHKDPHILKLGGPGENKPRPDDEAMLAIEFDNFIKEKSEKLTQSFKPFQIKMKALKINEYFSLRVLDQANVYLIYRDGSTNIKLNIGMILDHKEIVDTDTAEVGQVSSNLERFPAKTDSLADLQRKIAEAQKIERVRFERDVRINRPEPVVSVDRLYTAASKPLKPVLMTVDSKTEVNRFCKCRRPSACNVYYNTSIV